ncbi:MAG: hypothetical protein U9N36_09290 [Euryarchaeota archaeon]|nr:hypothetical protein [Euryarchaeota archaeon]
MTINIRIITIILFITSIYPILLIHTPDVSAQYPNNTPLSVGKETYALGETICISLAAAPEEIVFFNILSPKGILYTALPSTDREYQFKPDTAGSYRINIMLRIGDDEKFLTTGFEVADLEIIFGEPEQGAIKLGEHVNWSQSISIINHENFSILNFSVSIFLPTGHSNLSSDSGATIINSSIPVDLAAGGGTSFNITYQTPPVQLAVTEEKIKVMDLIPPDAFDIGAYKEIVTDERGPGLTDEITVKQVTVWHNSSIHYHDIPVAIESQGFDEIVEFVDDTGIVAEMTTERGNETLLWTVPELSDQTYTVVEVTREQGDARIGEPVKWQFNVSDTIIRYRTPAPFTQESKPVIADGTWKKEVVIGSNASVHYSNVTAYSKLGETEKSNLRLFWLANGSRIDVTGSEEFDVSFSDTDGSGIIDMATWNVPMLSNQSFEVEADITVLNVQSYPTIGGNWTVEFETVGCANLTITAVNQTTWSDAEEGDLQFLEIKCGDQILNYTWINGSIFIENYCCNLTSHEVSKVLTPATHTLQFRFGSGIEDGVLSNELEVRKVYAGYDPDLRVINVMFDHWDTSENRSSISETGTGCHVKEGRNITVNATIANYGDGNITSNFFVSFFDSAGVDGNWSRCFWNSTYNVSTEGELGNVTTGYPHNTTYMTGYWNLSLIGTHNISVWADPANSVSESAANATNNNASAVINVSAWQKYYGNVSGNIVLTDSASNPLYTWTWGNETDDGYAYIVNDGSSVNWSDLHALGCDSDDILNASGHDFLDSDTNLGMVVGSNNATGFVDNNITELFSGDDPSNATDRALFTVYGNFIPNVPIVNSTMMTNHASSGSANFTAGILWDATSDTNGYYDVADDETLVFVTMIGAATTDLGGAAYNYELVAPCTLNPVVGGALDIYVELK